MPAVMWLVCWCCCRVKREGSRARISILRLQARKRLRSSRGNPQPHLSHLRSMCCSHILCQTTSSSASMRQVRDTWAALHSDVVSR